MFTTVAILSLALGTGANTAIFTLMDQLMLRPLPIRDPQSLVMLYQEGPHNGSNMGYRMHSYPLYQDLQQKAEPFSEVLCRRLVPASLSLNNTTERVQAEMVSGNFFSMLGVKPAAGRLFDSVEDDRVYQGHPVVVLSYDYWTNRFNRDPKIIGTKVMVNNMPMTVIGVSAAGFSGLDPAISPHIRVPVLMLRTMLPEWDFIHMDNRRSRWVQVFARLKPGYSPQSAAPAVQGLFSQIRKYETTLPAARDWSKYAREQFLKGTMHLETAKTGYSDLRRDFSKALIVLMGMVGLVLLIACVNVANLLIARASSREKEIAVRLALGASRWQLVRQLLVESFVLSFTAAGLGVLLSIWVTKTLISLIPADSTPILIRPEPDLRILSFSIAAAICTGFLFGLIPALRATRPQLWGTLKNVVGSVVGSGGTVFLRKGLVTAQIVLSFLLLFGSGLFLRSLQNLKTTDTGFKDLDNLVTFQVSPGLNGYTDQRATQFYASVLDQVRGMPGVKAAGFASVPLLKGDEWDSTMSVEGHKANDGEDMQAFMNSLSSGYFDAMGINLIAGRDFDRRDAIPEPKTAIVNQKFARHFFGDRSPIGRHVGFGDGPKSKLDIEIIGVVADSLYEGPREGVRRQVFVAHSGNRGVAYYVRAARDSQEIYTSVREAVKRVDATMPIYDLRTLGDQLDQTLLTEHLIALLSAGFGLLATILAAIGLYGVMAYVVAQRTREIGLRMALGAESNNVLWMVLREVFLLVGIGLGIALPVALGLSRYIAAQLYGMKATDPAIASATVAILGVVALAAGLVPALRAARLDPMYALRYE